MAKSFMDGFANIDIELQPFDESPEIDPSLGQSLVRLFGWDEANKTWRALSVNSTGQVSTTTQETTIATGSYSAAAVGITATQIAPSNADRKRLLITNNHTDTLYIGFDNTVSVLTGYPINAGESIEITEYNGTVFGIMPTVAGDARILEF